MNYPVIIAGQLSFLAILAGLVFRGRWRRSVVFGAYCVAVATTDFLIAVWPDTFFRMPFHLAKMGAIDALKMGFVLEIAFRTFRVFPGARRTASGVVAAILGLGSFSLLFAPLGANAHVSMATFEPRVGNAVLWTIVATLGLARYYNVPVHPFHRNLLLVLGLYQTLFGGILTYFNDSPLHLVLGFLNTVRPVSYLLATCWWAYFAWQPETLPMREHDRLVQRIEGSAWA